MMYFLFPYPSLGSIPYSLPYSSSYFFLVLLSLFSLLHFSTSVLVLVTPHLSALRSSSTLRDRLPSSVLQVSRKPPVHRSIVPDTIVCVSVLGTASA